MAAKKSIKYLINAKQTNYFTLMRENGPKVDPECGVREI